MNNLLAEIMASLFDIKDKGEREKEAFKLFKIISSAIEQEQFLQAVERAIFLREKKLLKNEKEKKDDELFELLTLIFLNFERFLNGHTTPKPKLKPKTRRKMGM